MTLSMTDAVGLSNVVYSPSTNRVSKLTGSEPVKRKGIPWSAEAEMN